MKRLVIVIEYEVADWGDNPLYKVMTALRERAVHEPIEGARHVASYAAVDGTADDVVEAVRPR